MALLVFVLVAAAVSILTKRLVDVQVKGEEIRQQSAKIAEESGVLKQQTILLQQRDKLRQWLLASASHDIRTPISTLQLVLDSLNSDVPARETGLEALRVLDNLVLNLLDVSRIDAGVLAASYSDTTLEEIVVGGLSLLEMSRIVVSSDSEPVIIRTDEIIASRIVSNLVTNSLKNTAHNLLVRIEIKHESTRHRISVVDYGSGSAAHIEAALRGAENSASHRLQNSSGLGLLIAFEFAKYLNIDLQFRDTPGGGVTSVLTWDLK